MEKRLRKRVNITLPPELNDRWGKVAKRHHLKKSQMIEEFLEMVLPALEAESASTMIKTALNIGADAMKDVADSIK
jgi:predicted DNA-binding protein